VVLVGALVGYLRAAVPVALEAEEPILLELVGVGLQNVEMYGN
jgi:hypothetical protein